MSEDIRLMCPVCGAQKKDASIFNYSCERCKFDFAFVKFFADDYSKEHWLNAVNEYKKQESKTNDDVTGDYISICRDSVSFFSAKKNEVITLFGDGRKTEKHKNVAKFVNNDNNYAVLNLDGTVEVHGDNSYGQCNVSVAENVKFITLSSTCVFIVDSNKNIHTFGSLTQRAQEIMKKWRNVEKLVVSDSLIISVDSSNKIRCIDLTDGLVETIKDIESWNNVKKICLYKGSCVALLEDGNIVMSPEGDAYREIKTWEDIIDIVYDGTYVVGLTINGDIRLAGKCKSIILDAGRKDVISWRNMVSICSSNYAFGGYDKEGKLHLTGRFGGRAERLKEEWEEVIHLM